MELHWGGTLRRVRLSTFSMFLATFSRWWFQSVWKILAKLGCFPKWKKHNSNMFEIWNHHWATYPWTPKQLRKMKVWNPQMTWGKKPLNMKEKWVPMVGTYIHSWFLSILGDDSKKPKDKSFHPVHPAWSGRLGVENIPIGSMGPFYIYLYIYHQNTKQI